MRLGLAVVTALLLAAPASAAPVTLAEGDVSAPSVALAPSRDGYFVWEDGAGVSFCRIPESGTACEATTKVTEAGSQPRVYAEGGNPVVYVNGPAGEIKFTSSDLGSTFEPGIPAGTLAGAGLGSAFEPATGVLYGMTDAARFQRMPPGTGEAELASGAATNASVAADGSELTAVFNQGRKLFYRTTDAADPNDVAAWTAAKRVPGGVEKAASPVVIGPDGPVLLAEFLCPGDECNLVLVHPLGPAEAFAGVGAYFEPSENVDLDATGDRLHAVYEDSIYGLRYATTTNPSRGFGRDQRLAGGDVTGAQVDGGAKANVGWAVWVAKGAIQARGLPAPRDTSDDGQGTVEPLKHKGLKVIASRSVKGTTFFLYGPKRCVPADAGEVELRVDVRQRPAGKQFEAASVNFGSFVDDTEPFTSRESFKRRDVSAGSVGFFVGVKRANEGGVRQVTLKGLVEICG